MLGGVVGSYPADLFGRRWMILVVQVIMVGSCILEQLATHWTHWLGARLLDVNILRVFHPRDADLTSSRASPSALPSAASTCISQKWPRQPAAGLS